MQVYFGSVGKNPRNANVPSNSVTQSWCSTHLTHHHHHLLGSLLLERLDVEGGADQCGEAAQHQGAQQQPADPGGALWGRYYDSWPRQYCLTPMFLQMMWRITLKRSNDEGIIPV